MKILHIITSLDRGGAENVLKRLLENDTEKLNDVEVVSLGLEGAIGEQISKLGIVVHSLNVTQSPKALINGLCRLRKLIKTFQPQIVQTWMYHADLLGGLVAYFSGHRNIVWNIRIAAVPQENKLTIAIMRICALLSHWLPKKIICVAEAAKKIHVGYGYDAARMVVISNGLNFDYFDASALQSTTQRQSFNIAENDIAIGWVGRFHPDKGQENFVKAAAIVVKQFPHAKFILVGHRCDSENEQLMAWLSERNLLDRFVLLGERSDVANCLSILDVFCMPSSNEGFPNALAEAMAMGLPCVATDVGDTAIMMDKTGIVIEANNEQALADGLMQMLALPAEHRQALGHRAKARVRQEYSIEKACARFQQVYEELISRRNA